LTACAFPKAALPASYSRLFGILSLRVGRSRRGGGVVRSVNGD